MAPLPTVESTVIYGDGRGICVPCAVAVYEPRGVYCTGCQRAPSAGIAYVGFRHRDCGTYIGHDDRWDLLEVRWLRASDDPVICELCTEVIWPQEGR